ncbi:MAG TPA: hypothetical protein VGC51_13430 [Hansschlegelia sp.]
MTASAIALAKERLGLKLRKKRSLWLVGEDRASFEAAAPLIAAAAERYERMRIVLSGPPALRVWLAERFPGAVAHAAPYPFLAAARRFLAHGSFRSILALDGVALPPALIKAVALEGMALLALRTRADAPPARPEVARAAEAQLSLSEGVDAALDEIRPFLARDHKKRRKKNGLSPSNVVLGWSRRALASKLIAWRVERIADIADLARRLGRPQTILCLGNGPSSEDPRLDDVAYDALFRVNQSWRARGRFVDPAVVFTGNRQVMEDFEGVIFGLQTNHAEIRLAKGRILAAKGGSTRFFRVDEITDPISAHSWGAFRPSNGAAMVATAVALKPKKLVIAGIDLFRHPEGAYPGDSATPNAFVTAHDADAELGFLLSLLDGFDGELLILSNVLREALDHHRATARLPEPAAGR